MDELGAAEERPRLPLAAILVIGALALFGAITLVQWVLGAVFGLVKLLIVVAIVVAVLYAVMGARANR